MKIIFAGTPDFAAAALQACVDSRHRVVAVFTQPDRPSGRGQKINFSSVKQLAIDADIPVYQPKRLVHEQWQLLKDFKADVMLVSAYGLLLPKQVLNIPKYGCINIHASLLPKWRGAAPIQRAIIAGDEQSGISIMQMVEELDAGPVLQQFVCDIKPFDTGSSLHDRLAKIAANEIVNVLEQLQKNELTPVNQDESQVSYANKLSKQEANINWQQNAIDIERTIRAFNAWPVAYSYLNGQRIRIWEAKLGVSTQKQAPGRVLSTSKQGILVASGEGAVNLTRLQLAGGKVISAQDYLNAHEVCGQTFTSTPIDKEVRVSG